MSSVIAISNQKGGVGKTTSAVSISSYLALKGYSVLLVDFDPQGSATSGLGVQPEDGPDLYDLFFAQATLSKIVRPTQISGLFVAPSSSDLVGIEIEMGKTPGRELILKSEIALLSSSYDYILIDCPPSSGLLTLNAMGAAKKLLVPLQAEYYALEGISALMRTLEFVKETFNPELSLLGVFMTMVDSRTNLSVQVEAEAQKFFGPLMFTSKIPRSIRLSECPSHALPISHYDPESSGARAYSALTDEIIARCGSRVIKQVANG